MGKTSASRESIELLINNSKQTIRDYEPLLQDVEKTKAIFEAIPDSNKSSLELLQLTLEILSGGIAGMYECTIGLCRMLQTNSVYEKRYQMQTINLNQFEWRKYMMGKDSKGVFVQYCNLFSECTDNTTVSYLKRARRCIEPEAVFGQMKYNMAYCRFKHIGKYKVTMTRPIFIICTQIIVFPVCKYYICMC